MDRSRSRFFYVLTLCACLVLLPAMALGETPLLDPVALISPPDPAIEQRFGRFPAADDSMLVVGTSEGVAYVFEQSSASQWDLFQTITPGYDTNYWYAIDVDISGDVLMVTDAYYGNANIAIYRRQGGAFVAEAAVTPPANDRERFGVEMEFDGDDLVVRSVRGYEVVVDHFRRDAGGAWPLLGTWSYDTGASYPYGGLSLDGDLLAVGLRSLDDNRGRVVLFERDPITDGFVETQTLQPVGLDPADFFGHALSLDGDLLGVGTGFTDDQGANSGSAWLYERQSDGSWSQLAYLLPSDGAENRNVGSYIAVQGDRVLLSGRDLQGGTTAAYLFERQADNSFDETRLRYGGLAGLSWSGRGLALDGDTAYVTHLDTGDDNRGYLIAYDLSGNPVPPLVQVNGASACVTSPDLILSGTVTGSSAIEEISTQLNGGSLNVLCTDCGESPSFVDNFTLNTCDNTVLISAEDADGLVGSTLVNTRFDAEGPTLQGCPGDIFSHSTYVPYAAPSSAVDNCDSVLPTPTCRRSDHFPDDSFSFYRSTVHVTCSTTDSCGRYGSCGFNVTVMPAGTALPEADCDFYEFRNEFGGMPGFSSIELGDSTLATEYADDFHGTIIEGRGSSLGGVSDNGAFAQRTVSGDFRIETPMPTPAAGDTERSKGGVMVRWGLDAQAAMVMAARDEENDRLEFRIRPGSGQAGRDLADPIPLTGVTDLAIEVEGDRVTVQYSTDGGNTWTVPAGALGGAENIATSGEPQVGFVVSSQKTYEAGYYFTYATICPIEGVDPGEPPVDPDGPITGCTLYDFRDEVGGETPYVTTAALGDAVTVTDWLSVDGSTLWAQTSDLYHGNDNAGFNYLELDGYGDFRVEIPVPEAVDYSNSQYQKGGLMVRYGLDPLAARVMVMNVPLHPNGPSIQFDARPVAGGPATEMASTISSVGIDRLAIEKRDDLFVVEVSSDGGSSWFQPLGGLGGQVTLSTSGNAASGNALVGMAVASYELSNDVGFLFPEMEVCGEEETPPPPPIEPQDGCLFDPFDDGFVDAGWGLLAMGDADQVSVAETDVLQLTADGSTLFSSGTDHGGFLYRAVTGDFRAEAVVDVNDMVGTGSYRKGGLMLRAGLGADAIRFIAQLAPSWNNTGTTSLQFRYRAIPGARGDLTWASNRDHVAKAVHLAIERQGQTVRAFYSLDQGATWIQPVGGTGGAVTLAALPDTVYIGMNSVSYNAAEAVTTEFDDFSLCAPASVGGLLWWDQNADALAGEGEPPLDNVQMELRTLSNQPIFTVYTGDDGRFLFPRVEPGSYRLLIDSALGLGGNFTATVDPDGIDTQEYAIISVVEGQQVLDADFGFRVTYNGASPDCSHQSDDFDNDTLASFWFQTTFGDADQMSVVEQGGALSISGDGSSLYAGSDHGVFVFNHFQGDFRVEVDVDGAGMTTGGPYRKAGLMVRTGFGYSEPRYIAQLVPYWDHGTGAADSVLQFRYRQTEGGQSDIAWGSNVSGAPRQVRLAIQRSGNTLSAEYSFDGGVTWNQPAGGAQGSTTVSTLPDTLLVGMNVVSYDALTPSTAVFDNFEVCRD